MTHKVDNGNMPATIEGKLASRLGDRPVLVAHHAKHHLYNTAHAYLTIGRLAGFATQTYAKHPQWCRFIARSRIPCLAREASRVLNHYDKRLQERVLVQSTSRWRQITQMILGMASRYSRQPFQKWVGDLVVKHGWHCHSHCTGARDVFRECKKTGAVCILEQYIGDRRQGAELLQEECYLQGISNPEGALEAAGFTPEKIEINEEEYELADAIVAGSPFVVDSLIRADVPSGKIILVPYGVAPVWFAKDETPARREPSEPLQVAFVGHDYVRKGLVYALKAVAELGPATAHLHVFGCGQIEIFENAFGQNATYHGSLSGKSLRKALSRCHAAVLPSLCEGSALAVFEALACGLPAVVTSNTGAVVTNGCDGFVVPIRSHQAIAECLRVLLENSMREYMSVNARRTALRYTWGAYEHCLLNGLGLVGEPEK